MKNKEQEDDDEMPELEDFSNDSQKIKQYNAIKNQTIPVNVINSTSVNENINKGNAETKKTEVKKISKEEDTFGIGFKKGFLKRQQVNSNPDNSSCVSKNTNERPIDLTHIKSTPQTKDEKYKIEEVQKNLKSNDSNLGNLTNDIIKNKDTWLNQELLNKLTKNPKLINAFMHPEFNNMLSLLQKNPQEAKKKYGNNPQFLEFFKEFSTLMASHFESIHEKEKLQNPIMNDSEVKEILKDKKVDKFLQTLQKEGKIDYELINQDPTLSKKVEKLIEKGVLRKEFLK